MPWSGSLRIRKKWKEEIKDLQENFKKCLAEKEQTEIHLNRLKAALKRDIENRETIIKINTGAMKNSKLS